MSSMSYFRRPILTGKNLKRNNFASVRGFIRRHDPDGSSSAPYFPGITTGQTLLITTQTTSYTVTFNTVVAAGLVLNQALTDINTTLGADSFASDSDGTISITTNTSGATGKVSVTGGTAALALGFDVRMEAITSVGGEIASSPENRVGNTFGTSFLGARENFTSESITRGLGSLASNLDVLYSDSVKEDTVLQKITLTGSGDGKSVTPGSGRFFNGFAQTPILSASSTPEEISAFFVLIDPANKRVLPNRVVGMVVSPAPAGDPPYANAANPTDAGKNLFGLNLTKFAATAITAISFGRLVTCSGAGTAGVAGDVVGISGATNTTPWSNNGTKWVIESIVDANNLVLRPMSKAELNQLGVTLTEIQPVLELNESTAGSFGNLTIFTGMYSSGVSFIIRPPLSAVQNVELWAAQPLLNRLAQVGMKAWSALPFSNNKRIFIGISDSDVPFTIKRYGSGSTADLFSITDESGVSLAKISTAGNLTVGNITGGSVSASGNINSNTSITVTSSLAIAMSAVAAGTQAAVSGNGAGGGPGGVFLTGGSSRGPIVITPVASTPSAPSNGDLWMTTAGVLGTRANGNTRTLAFLEASQSWSGTQTFSSALTSNLDTSTATTLVVGGTTASAITLGHSGVAVTAPQALNSPVVNATSTFQLNGTGVTVYPAAYSFLGFTDISGTGLNALVFSTGGAGTWIDLASYWTQAGAFNIAVNTTNSASLGTITITSAGVYKVEYCLGIGPGTVTGGPFAISARVLKNGTNIAIGSNATGGNNTSDFGVVSATTILTLAASDVLKMQITNGVVTPTTSNLSVNSAYFTVVRIS